MATSPGSSSETTNTPSDTNHNVSATSTTRRARNWRRVQPSFARESGGQKDGAQIQEAIWIRRHSLDAFADAPRGTAMVSDDRGHFVGKRLL